jgi:hypothetical protein
MNVTSLDGSSSAGATAGTTRAASTSDFSALLEKARNGSGNTAADDIAAYVKMTPAQRMRADILKKMGLSEADLNAMPADQRQAIENKITAMIKVEMEQAAKNGQVAVG